ncbi:MAG TPA: c-type cytochrome biogenesis protein CcsB [Jatrophihabitans sp.]|nr:c-type cytochrome biogenesis protein CcsB [Jatrophihabitans sp.]
MVNLGLARLGDVLFVVAAVGYSAAMVAFTAEYAFGRAVRQRQSPAARVPAMASTVGTRDFEPGAVRLDTDPILGDHGPLPGAAGRAGVRLLILGTLIHAASIVIRGVAVDRVPWGNMYEFSSVVALMAVLAFLAVLLRIPAVRYLGGFILLPVLLVMFLTGTVLYTRASQLVPALQSYWLAIHVSAAATSEGVLMTSALMTGLYLLRVRYDRSVTAQRPVRFPISVGQRLPTAATLDKAAFRIVVFAFPLYTFGIIAGAIWAEAAWGRYWGWDPKETWAFIAWVIYASYLHARATAGWKGNRASAINLLGFAAMTFNFFVVNMVISGLHSYAGLN